MLNRMPPGKIIFLSLVISLAVGISGCIKPTEPPSPPTQPPAVTPVEEATALPTTPPARLLVVDPASRANDEVRSYLESFAAENMLVLEMITSPELPPQGEDTKVVIFLAEPANLAEIVSASPSTQFIVTGDVDIPSMPNLSVIHAAGEDMAFMAGYLPMQIAWDWRAGALIPNDVVKAAEKANAFENGARYVCGQCTPYYAPLVYFPLLGQESMQAGLDAWDAQIVTLAQHYVNSYYIDPAISTPEVLDRLKGLEDEIYNDVNLIGYFIAADDLYAALLDFDTLPALQEILPQALAGTGGQTVGAQVKIVVNNTDQVVTPAKVDNFNRVAADLAAGIIIPLSIP